MAAFVDTLAPEVKAKIEKLPDNEYEAAVMQLMEADKRGMLNPKEGTPQGGQVNG
jgi:hypothetical protein